MMSNATASHRLRQSISLLLPALSDVGKRFWNAENLAELYPRYLVATHTIIRASVPLMEDALAITQQRHADEPLAQPLTAYLARHIPEERSHDEWLLDDLARIGYPPAAALDHPPSPVVSAMVGSQYYAIRHVHPAVLLGYIAVLEGYPPAESLATQAAEATGYPVTAFRTLRKHAHLDPHHRRDLDEVVDRLPASERLHSLIRANALQTMDHLRALLEQILSGDLSSRLTVARATP